MESVIPTGIMPAMFTPINDDHTVNYDIIPVYAKYLTDAGIKNFLVGGTTSQYMTLSLNERKKIIDAWMAATNNTRDHIQVQVGGAPLADVLELSRYCQDIGVDSLLALSELYFKPSSVDELVFYISLVAKAAPKLSVFYYHSPIRANVQINMPAFVAAATASIPNFKGIKFASKDLSEGAQVLRNLKEGQQILFADETLIAPAALLGITYSTCTSYNFFPKLAQEILDAVENGDVQTARTLQEKLTLAVDGIISEGSWIPTMKAAMEIVTGIKVGPPCFPHMQLCTEAKQRIQSKLRSLDLCD